MTVIWPRLQQGTSCMQDYSVTATPVCSVYTVWFISISNFGKETQNELTVWNSDITLPPTHNENYETRQTQLYLWIRDSSHVKTRHRYAEQYLGNCPNNHDLQLTQLPESGLRSHEHNHTDQIRHCCVRMPSPRHIGMALRCHCSPGWNQAKIITSWTGWWIICRAKRSRDDG
jgi:hypothetical protein